MNSDVRICERCNQRRHLRWFATCVVCLFAKEPAA